MTQTIETTLDVDERKRYMFQIISMIQRREELRRRFADDPKDISWQHDASVS